MGESSYKIPNGKLVKVKLRIASGKIAEVRILGDFFLHPEETILEIEESLIGATRDEVSIAKTIVQVMSAADATLIGASPEDIVKTIMMAWSAE